MIKSGDTSNRKSEPSLLVVGAGHAGIEAALAASRMGCPTMLVTFRRDTIGLMSCNPAIGGVGKGQLVKEVDALGGEMGRAADACGIQFRVLNASKGPAVHSSRAQIDMELYRRYMLRTVEAQENLTIIEGEAESLLTEGNRVIGITLKDGQRLFADAVVLAPGTFLAGLMHVGLKSTSGGRIGEPASQGLGKSLADLGFGLLRFKTGTCPRIDKRTIDFSRLEPQPGDIPPHPFSFTTATLPNSQVPCHLTFTNERTHRIIRENLDKSPLYTGVIKSTGVRYCPSIEDKIVKFSDRARHQVFLEPQGLDSDLIYPNGISTSLPEEVQDALVHSIEGLEQARIVRYGYGIEHTVVEPTQLYPTLETKRVSGLFLAGQINGTTGYEEAAAQGLIAGINAALQLQKREPVVLDRSSGYIGVLIDDLTTVGTQEPYRMFTSRVEYRLVLREDNADLRLTGIGFEAGLVKEERYQQVRRKAEAVARGVEYLKRTHFKPTAQAQALLAQWSEPYSRRPLSFDSLLKRPGMDMEKLAQLASLQGGFSIPDFALQQVEIEVKYEGFIQRQAAEVSRFQHLEKIRLPKDIGYGEVPGLSREIREKLERFRPLTLGQASRISGVTPAAIALLMVYVRKISRT